MSVIPSGERTWIDAAADRFEKRWHAGPEWPRIEDFLAEAEPGRRAHLLEELVRVECELRRTAGETPAPDEYLARFPDDLAAVEAAFGLDVPPGPAGPPVSTSESLLFGLLALQNNFIDRDGLLAAFNAWVADKSKSLGQILVDRGALTPGRYAALELLVQEHVQKHGSDPDRSLAMIKVVPEVRNQLEQVADLDFQCTLMSLASATEGGTGGAADPGSTIDMPDQAESADPEGRFQIVRLHDSGGLGDVYVARDRQLHRIVALKRIQRKQASKPDQRARFVVEAEITGRLEHPCIVPVYSLGTFDDGRPFYTMRFIRGDNLEEAVKRFHKKEEGGLDPGTRTLELQKLLRRFLDVCNAIAYAHSRGVVHRDLKPGNIMLGQYGETLVVDWGLAKSVGRPEPVAASATMDDRTLVPEGGSDLRETRVGSQLGTPAYMSPEQAAGRVRELGPRSDVYSLGATLYCLLTGRAPFEKQPVVELMRKVEHGEFPPPRQVQGGIDPALEAICLKAMKTDPADRYATPRALADDVEHWLADEPVGAYSEPFTTQAKRWMRKHPSGVTAAAVLLLATVVGLTIGGALLKRSNNLLVEQTRRANDNAAEADRQRSQADAMSKEARHAVDTYFNHVCEQILPDDNPAHAPMRKELLTLALNYYQRFIEEKKDDPNMRRELADAYRRLGHLGVKFEGQSALSRSVEMYEAMLKQSPRDRALRGNLAGSLGGLGHQQYDAGQDKAALGNFDRAIELLSSLWEEDPTDVELGRGLGDAYSWRSLVRYNCGDWAGHDADSQRAIGMLEKLVSLAPADEKDTILSTLFAVYFRDFGLPNTIKAIGIGRERAKYRGIAKYGLPGPLKNLGYLLIFRGQPVKGEPLVREASEIIQTLAVLFPESGDFFGLDWPMGEVGESLYLQGKTRAAREQFDKTMENWKEVQKRNIAVGGNNLINHSRFNYLFGCLVGETGDPAEGIEHCEQALKEQQQVRDQQRGMAIDNPEALSDLL